MNIKVNDIIIPVIDIVDNKDTLGIMFNTKMTLSELDNLFTPASSPEIRIVDNNGEVTDIYKNRKLITLRTDVKNENELEVSLVLQVTPIQMEEIEALTLRLDRYEKADMERLNTLQKQETKLASQEEKITTQETEISNLRIAVTNTENQVSQVDMDILDITTKLNATQDNLDNTLLELSGVKEENEMLINCLLEMSEIVYA